jgi:hypothetical protein
MTTPSSTSPLSATRLVDEYFNASRNRILVVAAFLDRLDWADAAAAASDFRVRALTEAIAILAGGGPQRVREIQMLMSDPTTAPLEALDRKGAVGAWDRSTPERR